MLRHAPDKCSIRAGRSLLIWTGFFGLGMFQPFVYAYMTGDKWLCATALCASALSWLRHRAVQLHARTT